MTTEDLISHIQENNPYQIKVKRFDKNVMTTVHSDDMAKKIDRIRKFASTNNGVYTVVVRQAKNTRDVNATIFEAVSFGASKVDYTKPMAPVAPVNADKIRKEIEAKIRLEHETQKEYQHAKQLRMKYQRLCADLETGAGRMQHVLTALGTQMFPGLFSGLASMGTNSGPLNGTSSLSVDNGMDDNARVQRSVYNLLSQRTISVDEFVLLCDTLATNPQYVTMLKSFIPKS